MKSFSLLGAVLAGVSAVALPMVSAAQQNSSLTLGDALRLSGVISPEGEPTANPRIVGPREDVAAAASLVGQARLRPNPEVSFEAENILGTGDHTGLQASEFSLVAGLPLELGGKRSARVRAAEADLRVATLTGQLTLADVGLAVRQRYVSAVAAQQRVALAEDVFERNKELARISAVLVETGREAPLRSLRAQAELARAEAELKAAQADALAARMALGALWAGEEVPAVGADFPELVPPYGPIAEYSRLEPQVARAQREAAQAAAVSERFAGRPDPTVSAGVRRFQETSDQALLVGVSVPLPLRNRNQGNIAAAEARARAAVARETVALLDYRQTVAEARATFVASQAKAETLEAKSLPQAEEALRLADIGFRNGKFSMLEVLSAAEARDEIRRELIDAREAQGKAAALLIRLAAQ